MNKNRILFFLFFLVIFFDSIFFNLDAGVINITLLRVILMVFLIIFCKDIFYHRTMFINNNIKFIFIFFIIWFIQMTLSIIWAIDKISVIRGIYYYFIFIFIILVIIYLVKQKLENDIFYSINSIAILMGLLSLIEYFGLIRFNVSRYTQLEYINILETYNLIRVTGTFVNENDFSLLLAILFPFLLISLYKANTIRKILSLIFIPIYLFIIYNNDAKLVLIMIVIEVVVLLLLLNWKRKTLVYSVIFSSIIIGIFLFVKWFIVSLQTSSATSSIVVRWNLLLNTWYALKETYFIGGGILNFSYYQDSKRYFDNITNPHNWWVELLVEHGIFITLLYICVYGFIIIKLIKMYKNPASNNLLILPVIMSLIGLIIGSIAPSGFFYFWPQWFLLGLAIAIINNEQNKGKNDF